MNNTPKSKRISIEKLLLPNKVNIAKQQIRMFETEGEKLSSEYTKLYKKGLVVPNSTKNNDSGQLTVLIQSVSTDVYRSANNLHLNPKFVKAYREGRVITKLADGILKFPKAPSTGNNKNKKHRKVTKTYDTVLSKMKSNKEVMKEHILLTKNNDKFHTVKMKIKLSWYELTAKKEVWFTFTFGLSVPVLRAFVQFSSRTTNNIIIYDFEANRANGYNRYDSLIKFLEFINSNKYPKYRESRIKKHTPDGAKRDVLKEFVNLIDTYLNSDSRELEEINIIPSEQLDSEEMTMSCFID
jgi:hypothetical protein